jgi:hypothetical protein
VAAGQEDADMTPTPVALSLSLCDYVIIEEGTGKPSLIGCFDRLIVSEIPSEPRDFSLAAELSGGHGRGRVSVDIRRPDTDESIWRGHADVYFRDRLFVVRYRTRMKGCSFPVPGRYAVMLLVDGDLVGQRTIEVTTVER